MKNIDYPSGAVIMEKGYNDLNKTEKRIFLIEKYRKYTKLDKVKTKV